MKILAISDSLCIVAEEIIPARSHLWLLSYSAKHQIVVAISLMVLNLHKLSFITYRDDKLTTAPETIR